MRSKGPWVVVLLAVAGVAAWALTRSADAPTADGEAGRDGDDVASGAPGTVDPATLAAAGGRGGGGPGAPLRPTGAHRGRATLVGTVRRQGAPVAARVEVRFSVSADPEKAMRGGPAAFFARVVAPPLGLEPPAAVATAGDDGRFAIEGLAAGAWHVRAVTADGARGAASVDLAVDGARASVDVAVGGGREVFAGRVVRADGTPFQGLVTVDRAGGGRQGLGSLVAVGELLDLDREGRFRATGLEAGAYVVSAIEVGAFRAVGKPIGVPMTQPYVLTVGGLATPLEGRVVGEADGAPVAGAEVLAGGRGSDDLELVVARTTSDAEGKFVLTVGSGTDGAVVISAPGYALAMVTLALTPTGPLEVRLARTGSVSGRVTAEAAGTPVGGLRISATSAGRGLPFAGPPVVTDADGRYRIDDVAPGEALVTAEGGGWVPKDAGDPARGFDPLVALVEPGKVTTVDLVVARGARLAGVVLGPDGAPSPGAVVRALARASDAMPRPGGPTPTFTPTASGADGVFLLEGLASDRPYDVVVTAPGAAETRVGPTLATTATPPPRVEVRLVPIHAIDVLVVDAEKATPVVGATVRVTGTNGIAATSRVGAVTDGQGRARVEVAPGAAATVHVAHEDFLPFPGTKVVDGEPRVVVTLRPALTISGTVLQPDGTPAAAARVTSDGRGRWVRPTQTDARGRFRLTSLEAGTYDVEARLLKAERVGLVATASVAAGTTDLVLKLVRPEGQATGLVVKVLDPDGKPVPRAYVQVDYGNGGSSGSTAEDGVAIVDVSGRAAGLAGATVVVRAPRARTGTLLPFGPARLGPLTGHETEVEIRLPVEATVTGVVRDPDGAPVRGAVVIAATEEQGRNLEGAFTRDGGDLPRARTDADGRFRLGGLADGAEVDVHVAPPPDFPRPEPVRVRGGQQDVVVTLVPGTAVVVTVLDEAGAPVQGATVNTTVVEERRDEASWRLPQSGPQGRADATGAVRLRGLDLRKRYGLAVDGPAEGWLTSRREAWSPKNETVRLARALKVAGVVRDPAGRPLAGVQVSLRVGEGSWRGGATTDAAGRFELDGLPAGEVVLRVAVGAMGGTVVGPGEAEVRTHAGATDVAITLDPGLEIVLRLADRDIDVRHVVARLVPLGPDGASRSRGVTFAGFDADGVGRARGLTSADRFVVWIGPVGSGRSFLARDVRAGADVVVVLRPGLTIRGRVTGPPGATNFTVSADLDDLGVSVPGVRAPDGSFEIAGLPEGTTWRLLGTCAVDGRWLSTRGPEVAAGGTTNIDVKEGPR